MNPNVERYELTGLCMTCNHAGLCMHLARAKDPIWRCEDFDDSVPIRRSSTLALEHPAPIAAATKPPGLCMNCDNLPTCCLPKSEAGVWHCEEHA